MVSESFREVWQVIPILSFAFVFHGVYFFFINILFVKDTGWVFLVTLGAMIVDIILNVWLVPIWGFWGAGVACFMTYFSRGVFALILSRMKNKDIRYNWFAMFAVPMVFLALSFVNWLFVDFSFWGGLAIKLGFCSLLGLGFFLVYKEQIQTLLKARVKK